MHSTLLTGLLLFYTLALLIAFFLVRRSWQKELEGLKAQLKPREESPSVKYLKQQNASLQRRDLQRQIYLQLTKVMATAESFDAMVAGMVEALAELFHATHGGLLWRAAHPEYFDFVYRKGYSGLESFRLPLRASLAGTSILRKEPVFVDNPVASLTYVPLPGTVERNVLCIPIEMFRDFRGVMRLSNLDNGDLRGSEIEQSFKEVMPLIASAMEKVLISQENQRRKRELEAISGINQLLHRTLDIREICAAGVKHLKMVFDYSHCSILRYTEDENLEPLIMVPREIRFSDNSASSRIIQRNLLASPQPLLVEDLRTHEKVKTLNRELGSLIATPILMQGKPYGTIVMTTATPQRFTDDDLSVLGTLSEHLAVTMERAIHFGKQENHATRDPLTGLFNHRLFQERLALELQRQLRYKRPFSLLLMDIDHFKAFNDTYGHQTGDTVLRHVAQALQSSCRTTDMAFRYGGEEFCIILPETDLSQAAIFAQRLNAKIRNSTITTSQGILKVTISIGVAQAGGWSNSADVLVEAADKAMYKAKQSGRDRVCLYKKGQDEIPTTTVDGVEV